MFIPLCAQLLFILFRATSSTTWVPNPHAALGTPGSVMWPTAPFVNYVCRIQI